MITLAIDPGLAFLGWCVRSDAGVIKAGVFHTSALAPKVRKEADISKVADKMRRADELGRFLQETIDTFRVSVVAHEAVSLGFHQSLTLFDLGLAFGAVAAAAAAFHAERVQVTPAEIKDWTRRRVYVAPVISKRGKPRPGPIEKDHVIRAVQVAFPDLNWPKATTVWQHMADAVVVGEIVASRPRAPRVVDPAPARL